MAETGRRNYLYLDGLRGLAAIIVAFGHFKDFGYLKIPPTMALWVGFFFLLSGFILAKAYADRVRRGELGFRDYVVLRLARLYPLHLLTGILCGVMIYASSAVKSDGSFTCGPVEFFEALTLTQLLFGGHLCFNAPSWSISVEFWCSLAGFILFLPGIRMIKFALAGAVTALFMMLQMQGGTLDAPQPLLLGLFHKNYVSGLFCFMLGFWLAGLVGPRNLTPWRGRMGTIIVLAMVLATVMPGFDRIPGYEMLFYIAAAAVIALFATTEIPSWRPWDITLRRSGEYSYGIYLWHMFVLMALGKVILIVRYGTGIDLSETLTLQILFTVLVIVVAQVSYQWFEIPAKNWIRQKLSRVSMA